MELIDLKKELEEIEKRITEFKTSLKIEDKEQRVAEIENMMLDADFWNDSDKASALVTESKSIKKELDEFSNMIDYLEHSSENSNLKLKSSTLSLRIATVSSKSA